MPQEIPVLQHYKKTQFIVLQEITLILKIALCQHHAGREKMTGKILP